jgi:choline dehydrogenase-like flavoprotein
VEARRGTLDPKLVWHLDHQDAGILAQALHVLAEIFFAAGARSIVPGVHGIPTELYSREEADVLRTKTLRPSDLVIGGNHAFCTTRMHGDPARGVVDELGLCHDFDNLWIADSGVFPRCPSVNPMWTIMALARRSAHALADRL